MPEYQKGYDKPIPHSTTKYDGFKLIKTEFPYKHQEGSGRAAAFALAKDGMTIGDWAKACATTGAKLKVGDNEVVRYFDSKFIIGSLIKLQGAKEPGWKISEKDDQGRTLADVKKIRDVDPMKLAEREKAKAEREKAKAAKAEAREKAKAEKEKQAAAKKDAAAAKKAEAAAAA